MNHRKIFKPIASTLLFVSYIIPNIGWIPKVIYLFIYGLFNDTFNSTDFVIVNHRIIYIKQKKRGFGPIANYADRATAACCRSSANFCGWKVLRGQRNRSTRSLVSVFLTGAAAISSK
jgi:hypothetical protein